MQLAVPLDKFDVNNVFFSEKKRNVVIDGDFIKIIYSDANIEMSELYILCSFSLERALSEDSGVEDGFVMMKRPGGTRKHGKYSFEFDTTCYNNAELITRLCAVETCMLNKYINEKGLTKTPVHSLRAQLSNGVIRGGNVSDLNETKSHYGSDKKTYIIKISGIWETDTAVGITLKFLSYK